MRRSIFLAGSLAGALACTDPREPARAEPNPEPAPTTMAPVEAEPEAPADLSSIEMLVLTCDGAALVTALAELDVDALTPTNAGPSTRLLARWEADRRFTSDGVLDPAAIASFTEALTRELGQAPPRWWVEQLASGRRRPGDEDGVLGYDVGIGENRDRRGERVPGPGGTSIRPDVAAVVSASNGKLAYDLSMGRLELGPLPTGPDTTLEISRARAGSTVYYASFSPGAGGFRFPIHAVEYGEDVLWTSEVCGPDRQVLGGLGYLTVEIVVLEPDSGAKPGEMKASSGATGVAVFTAESHGVALDVFDPASGLRTLAWSSDLWFARR